ncbi:ankyrin repeat domain-containing protein SOWAHB isoform X2 [Microcaecilia unicolor]|uniref:Ankyrin repeat domain-containing protein SOWAHB-like isoform X2 n=1 Tax=Microcaecilia unicolor TaxID=1415580 RepID=A0A6P7YVC2_9AMPH|nr:ankyrin repeat domain-containing protein SOWAHB-like isoform X2 [Microcaecilia unicolor]
MGVVGRFEPLPLLYNLQYYLQLIFVFLLFVFCPPSCLFSVPDALGKGGYTPLHIAALHGHREIMELLILDYGAKQTVRDYSGRLPAHYLKVEGCTNGATGSPQFQHLRGERRNRKLACLFLPKSSGSHSKKRWGSAEDLTEEEEEKGNGSSQHLNLPAPYRVRKFSR